MIIPDEPPARNGPPIDLRGRVAIVTGAGGGLGAAHADALARRGARVVVNDLDPNSAEAVCQRIIAGGGEAMAAAADVVDRATVKRMCGDVIARWGRIDILVTNAGVVRDRSFGKMDLTDFQFVLDVHLIGSALCAHVAWPIMRAQKYGRVMFTTSAAGLYGNFGQANYGAAKMGLVGLMQTLAIEGARDDIRVNCLCPVAATSMTKDMFEADDIAMLDPELVTPAVIALASEAAPTRAILLAAAGCFGQAHITMSPLTYLGGKNDAAEALLAAMPSMSGCSTDTVPLSAEAQWLAALRIARDRGEL